MKRIRKKVITVDERENFLPSIGQSINQSHSLKNLENYEPIGSNYKKG
jgi:hypothetical protein